MAGPNLAGFASSLYSQIFLSAGAAVLVNSEWLPCRSYSERQVLVLLLSDGYTELGVSLTKSWYLMRFM